MIRGFHDLRMKLIDDFSNSRKAGETYVQFRDRIDEDAARQLRSVLSDKQLLTIYRSRSQAEYLYDLRLPFGRSEFQKYLEITSEDLNDFLDKVEKVHAALRESRYSANRRCFERIAKELPDNTQVAMKGLFERVWTTAH